MVYGNKLDFMLISIEHEMSFAHTKLGNSQHKMFYSLQTLIFCIYTAYKTDITDIDIPTLLSG